MDLKFKYIIIPIIVFVFSCAKKNVPPPPAPSVSGINATPIDSFYNEPLAFTFMAGNSFVKYPSIGIYGSYGIVFGANTNHCYNFETFDSITPRYIIFFKSGFLKPNSAPVDSIDWKLFLAVGSSSFATCKGFGGPAVNCPGIYIQYKDQNDTVWYSAINSSYNQQNSNFTITKSKYYYSPPSSPYTFSHERVKFKGTFNCVLYSVSGNTLNIANGKFVQSVDWGN